MSFSISRNGNRERVAEYVRSGDHHPPGESSQFDEVREYIASEVEKTGMEGDIVALLVAGHHSDFGWSLSLSITVTANAPPMTNHDPTDPTSGLKGL